MKIKAVATSIVLACVLACSVALAGCSSSASSGLNEEQRANRAYMSQVNETMVELDADLDTFVDAVSRGDIVNMRTQAQNAYQQLDKLSKLEAPEKLADVHKGYVDGADKLRKALDEYVDLYAEAAQAGLSFDWDSYDERIKSIQSLYDEGVKMLEEGDKKAAEA